MTVSFGTVGEVINAPFGEEHLPQEREYCEALLQHACDADYGDAWQCDRDPLHEGRHHTMAGTMGDPNGDGFDAACVELWWHDEDEDRH